MPNRKLLQPTYLYAAIGVMLILHLLLPGPRLLTVPLIFAGLLPLVAGVAINLLADRAFTQHHTTVRPFAESSALVTSGVFRRSRNPMYLGFVLGLVGIALLLGSLTPWIVVVLFPFVIHRQFIRFEERMLLDRFGPAYRDYRARTRRWL